MQYFVDSLRKFYLINKFISKYPIESIEGVARFILVVFVATSVSATMGVLSLAYSGLVEWSAFQLLWMTWWLGDAVGGLVFTPFIIQIRARFSKCCFMLHNSQRTKECTLK